MRHAEVFFPFLRDLPTGAKIIPAWASLSRSNPKCWGISFILWKILRWLIRWPCEWIILFFFFVVFFSSFQSWGKSVAMHKNHKSYWSNIWRLLLFFFNIRHYEKSIYWTRFKRSIKLWALDIFPVFTCQNQNCIENKSIYTSARFDAVVKLSNRFYITFKSVALWKLSDMKIVPNYSF